MPESLYNQLKSIGIDEELAHEVDKSLSPDHVATRQDFLILQETILQTQLRSEKAYQGLRTEIVQLNGKIDTVSTSLNARIDHVDSSLRLEIAAISRHFRITFGGLITTILSVFGVNWYFH